MTWLDDIPLSFIVVGAILMALAPFHPEPHLVEKVRMLVEGNLVKPLDIFDLIMHSAPLVLLVLKLVRVSQQAKALQ